MRACQSERTTARTGVRIALLLSALLLASTASSLAARKGKSNDKAAEKSESEEKLPTLAEKTSGFQSLSGFLDLHIDPKSAQVWLEVPAPDDRGVAAELIYLEGLTSGLGSNPIGLDRGQLGESKLIALRRVGKKVLFEQPNLAFRALSDDPAERRAVEQSFAPSVLWAAEVAALDGDGRSLIDLSPFLLRDAHDVRRRLEQNGHGAFALDADRSALDIGAALAFPDNVELEAVLTYVSDKPGDHVARTAPTPNAFTLRQHHSFIRLPEAGYETREFDPRMPSYGVTFKDYAVALDEPIDRRWIARHRLEKTDPSAERSTVREPIVYYLDPGAPEPVRSALLEGASWWAEAFDDAGFIDAYRVELLPEGAHPLDVRYNVIQWVHRSTRGWSYGFGITDPRTGEIIKGHVSLGSLRVRQDILLFEGLAGTELTGSGAANDPVELALARIRQLSAHEVGHTLGFTHNFAASTYDDRASVMDYPAPLVEIGEDGELDLSRAYGVGIGSWDRHSVRFAYAQFPDGIDEAAALEEIVQEGIDRGLLFLADDDARPAGASDPRASLWDNGTDPVAALETSLAVRRHALDRFGERNLRAGRPRAELQEVLAPVYFHHRFQLDAAAKVVGGLEYDYTLAGDGRAPSRTVSSERQERALNAILTLLTPEALDLSEALLEHLVPRPWGQTRNREMFASRSEPAFDPLSAAATVATQVVDTLLQPERLARLRDFHRRDATLPAPSDVIDRLVAAGLGREAASARHREIERTVGRTVVERLIAHAMKPDLDPELRGWLEWGLRRAHGRASEAGEDLADRVHAAALTADIDRFLERDQLAPVRSWSPPPAPPGSPIGSLSAPPRFGGCSTDH